MHVSVVQAQWDPAAYQSECAYRTVLKRYLDTVKAQVPKGETVMVAFPEDFGTFLVFCGAPKWVLKAPTLDKAIKRLVLTCLPSVLFRKLKHGVSWVRALALAKSCAVRRVHDRAFSEAAKEYGYWLVTGTICVGGSGPRVFNECPVYSPKGELVHSQRKVHLIDLEGPSGLDISEAPVGSLGTFDVDGMKVGVAICLDAFKDDVLDALCGNGIDILVQPSANPGRWTPEQQLDWLNGTWKAVVKDGRARWGLNPMYVGDLFGLGFQGQSSIVTNVPGKTGVKGGYSDCPGYPGFAAVVKTPTSAGVVVVDVG